MKVTPWTPIETGDVAEDAPDTAGLNLAYRDDAHHCRQIIYDPDEHTAPTASGHAHRGDESSNVGRVYPSTPNLLAYPYATSYSSEWVLHSGVRRTNAGFTFSAGGQWASLLVGDFTRPSNSLSIFGAGAHLVVSGCLIADRALTKGSVQFGLSTGGGAGDDEERSFVEGARVDVPGALIDTSWRRFWAVINTEGMEFTKSIRFTVQCRDSPMPVGATVSANLFDLRPGQLLDYPVLSYVTDTVEISGYSFNIGNQNWSGYGYAPTGGPPPPLDHAMMITNAIKLKAR